VNVASTVVNQPQSFNPAYTASKGAVDALTRSVAVYCMERGDPIRCNSVQPHAADTPLLQKTLDELFAGAPPGARERMVMKLGSPTAVANAVLFLASDESCDLNGTALTLDRGSRIVLAAGPE
jgi:3(or 17)beta-hydroxysteroid dehydrogenase